MKLLGSTKKDVDQDKDGKDVPKLESVEVALVHCNLLNTNHQETSKELFTFVPNKHKQIQNFYLLTCGLLIKIVSLSKLKIMSI